MHRVNEHFMEMFGWKSERKPQRLTNKLNYKGYINVRIDKVNDSHEINIKGIAGIINERHAHFTTVPTVFPQIALDDGVAALGHMLVAQRPQDPSRHMPLPTWSL